MGRIVYDSILSLELSLQSSIKFIWRILWWCLSQQYINGKKKKVFTFSSILLCLPPLSPTFLNMTPIYLKSSTVKYSNSIRRNNRSWFVWKKQWRPIVWNVWLRKQRERWRLRQERKLKSRGLQKRRRRRNGWSISNNSRMRC